MCCGYQGNHPCLGPTECSSAEEGEDLTRPAPFLNKSDLTEAKNGGQGAQNTRKGHWTREIPR